MLVRLSILLALLLGGLLLNVCLGEFTLTPDKAFQLLQLGPSGAEADTVSTVLFQVRLPRLLCAFTVGAALGVSGYILQVLSHNDLADPFLTGVSSGAGLAIAIALPLQIPYSLIPLVAVLGGLAAAITVAALARSSGGLSVARLLLSGLAVSAACAAVVTLLLCTAASEVRLQGLLFWLAGSLSGRGWAELVPAAIYCALAFCIALLMSKQLRLLRLGTQTAQSLGANVAIVQWLLLALAVVLCAASVAVAGIVGFVGLMSPYLARGFFSGDERWQLFASAGFGAVLVLAGDLIARTAAGGQELPLGALLSLIGAPFFLWLINRRKEEVA